MNLIETFQRYIEENSLATHDDRILLTVSGGVDSMVMLSLFTRCGYRVVAAVRGALHMKRVGHAGTLDPMATGVLVVGLPRCPMKPPT